MANVRRRPKRLEHWSMATQADMRAYDFIDQNWTDIRPRSLRQRLA